MFLPKPCHPFDKFTFLKAALVVNVVGFEKLFELAYTEGLDVLSVVDGGERDWL